VSIINLGYEMVQEIIDKYFKLISETFFVDCVTCLVAYGNGPYISTSIKAIDGLLFCSKQLAIGEVYVIPKESDVAKDDILVTEDDKYGISLWFPIFTGLSKIVSHPHVDVRTK
jgi:hypothetical protein